MTIRKLINKYVPYYVEERMKQGASKEEVKQETINLIIDTFVEIEERKGKPFRLSTILKTVIEEQVEFIVNRIETP